MFKMEIIWIVRFVNYVWIVLMKLMVLQIRIFSSILQELNFWIIEPYSYDNLKNWWRWYFCNFIIVIARCVNDWILELFFKFPCIVRIYAWFFMHCRNHHSDSHANHVIMAICAGNSPVLGEFPTQRPVTRSFETFFDLRPNKRSKQWWGWWFETPSCPLWCPCDGEIIIWANDDFVHCSIDFNVLIHYLNQWWPSSLHNRPQCVNSLWHSDAIWQHRCESTFVPCGTMPLP